MQLKDLKIGNVQLKNNVLVAPLAGYTDFAFRKICYSLGASLCFTEMVSAKGLYYNNENTELLLKTTDFEPVKAVQIFGNDSEIMAKAVEDERLSKFDIIDINMGCPVPKVFSNGEGSALLKDLRLASEIISACAKFGKPITVKTRIGINHGDNVAVEFAKMAEDSGASMITVHGRVREDYYNGEPDYDAIASAKKSVRIPVIANGGIFTVEDADKMLDRTGADGVMLARGAMCNPLLISELVGVKSVDMKKLIFEHIDLLKTSYSDEEVAVTMRKQLSAYLKGAKNAKNARVRIFSSKSTSEIKSILNDVVF